MDKMKQETPKPHRAEHRPHCRAVPQLRNGGDGRKRENQAGGQL